VSINDDTSYYVYILTHTISFDPQPTMKVNIHNQCSDFKLTNGRDSSAYVDWNKHATQEVDAGNMTSAVLTSSWAEFEVDLMYRLQRKDAKSDEQLESIHTLLLITCKSEGYEEFCVFVQLIECDETFPWDKIRLKEFYQKYPDQFCMYTGSIKDTWLTRNGNVLITRLELDLTQSCGVLSITISDGIRNDYTKRPLWIDPKM
jgi:hypothetical protein